MFSICRLQNAIGNSGFCEKNSVLHCPTLCWIVWDEVAFGWYWAALPSKERVLNQGLEELLHGWDWGFLCNKRVFSNAFVPLVSSLSFLCKFWHSKSPHKHLYSGWTCCVLRWVATIFQRKLGSCSKAVMDHELCSQQDQGSDHCLVLALVSLHLKCWV